MAQLIDGKKLATEMQAELKGKIDELKEAGIHPGLVVILVGEDPASQVYVRNKDRASQKAGINSKLVKLPVDVSEAELLEVIAEYNQDPAFHGILVQMPLPKHIDPEKVIMAIDPAKDVDGFHPMNVGKLINGQPDAMVPCTPFGIIKMFEAYDIPLANKNAVVIGRSNIVGKPMAHLLLEKNATVTIAHSWTKDLAQVASQADILVVAIGRGHFVTKEFVKPGAVVIDVGMNRDSDGKLIGDVKFDEVEPLASFITPVPGGVGPMTITMLLYQTVAAAKQQSKGE